MDFDPKHGPNVGPNILVGTPPNGVPAAGAAKGKGPEELGNIVAADAGAAPNGVPAAGAAKGKGPEELGNV